jgi:ATP-dependent DNA ligase
MPPTLVRAPFHRDGWVFEEKGGWVTDARVQERRARVWLVSRHGIDHTKRFADIARAIAKLSARTLVLDGEVAIFDQQLQSRFEWLRDPDPAAVATPPLYMDLRHPLPRPQRPERAATA